MCNCKCNNLLKLIKERQEAEGRRQKEEKVQTSPLVVEKVGIFFSRCTAREKMRP
jgi:hypothetical protein